MQVEENAPEVTPRDQKWLLKLRPWVLAFAVPFLLMAIPMGYHWYCYQWEDISWRHPGAFFYEDANSFQSIRSCWESGIFWGLLFGVPCGLLGLAGYGCFVGCRMLARLS